LVLRHPTPGHVRLLPRYFIPWTRGSSSLRHGSFCADSAAGGLRRAARPRR
jgi:hypothetical protein